MWAMTEPVAARSPFPESPLDAELHPMRAFIRDEHPDLVDETRP